MAFSFGQPSTTAGTQGFSFGSTQSAAPGGFSFGTPASSSGGLFGQANAFGSVSQPTIGGFTFGGSNTGSTSGASLFGAGSTAATTTAASSGFSFASNTSQPTGGGLFNFASTAAPASTAAQNMGSSSLFSFKTPGTTTVTGLFQSSPAPAAFTQPTTGGLLFGSAAPGKPDGQSANTGATTSTGGFAFGGSLFQMPGTKASTIGSSTGTSSPFTFGQSAQTGAAVPAAMSSQPTANIFGKPNTSFSGQAQPVGGLPSNSSSLFQGLSSGTTLAPTAGASVIGTTAGAPTLGTVGTGTTAAMTGGMTIGGITAAATQGGSLFGTLTSVAPQTSTFSFGAPVKPAGDSAPAASSASTSIFTIGKTPAISHTTAASGTSFKLPVATAAATSAGVASFGAPAFSSVTTSAPTFGALQPSTTSVPSTATTGLTFPATGDLKTSVPSSSSALASSFTFGAPKVDAGATTATTGATSTAITESAFKPAVTAQASTSGPAPTTATSTISTGPKLTYKQLEDIVNKWIQELEEQERVFLNQASQVNSWDRLLIENGEKITELHDEVERVKADQKRLDRELDFILSQQQELEDILKPLEENIRNQESIQYVQHTDIERERTYKLAENIDVELKRMMEDLREIIEHVNASNLSNRDQEDPMTQIVKILNAHMDALQWVDQNSGLLGRRVEEVARLMESRRRDHEKTMKLSFD